MEENTSGGMPLIETAPMPRVRTLRPSDYDDAVRAVVPPDTAEAFGGTPGTPVGRVRVEEDQHGIRPVPIDADYDRTWWDPSVLDYAAGGPIAGEVLTGGIDPFVFWCRRALHALAVAAATAGTVAWLLILIAVVQFCWSELWL